MTVADFYLNEAVRCERLAEQSVIAERSMKWQGRAQECLQLATELEAAESPRLIDARP
jgi:hypothetical protein